MPLIEVDPVDDALHGLIERGIFEDDIGCLAAKLQSHLLLGSRHCALYDFADTRRTGECNFVYIFVVHKGGPCSSGPRDDIHDAGRQPGIFDDLGQLQSGQRGGLRRFEHDGIPAGQSRGNLPGRHQEWEVPRRDLSGHTERGWISHRKGIAELIGPARIVEEVGGRQRDVDVPTLPNRLAAVHAFDDGQLPCPLLYQAGNPVDVLASLFCRQLAPGIVVGLAGSLDGPIDITFTGLGNRCDLGLIEGIDGRKVALG